MRFHLRRYPYISHLICNAGCGFWSGVDKLLACRQILDVGLSLAITIPKFKLQHTGVMSGDGLGCTWQSNIFGHYIMVRHSRAQELLRTSLTPALAVPPIQNPLRIVRDEVFTACPSALDELVGRPTSLVRP